MEINEQLGEVRELVVGPSPVEVVVNEDGVSPLSFVMIPPCSSTSGLPVPCSSTWICMPLTVMEVVMMVLASG